MSTWREKEDAILERNIQAKLQPFKEEIPRASKRGRAFSMIGEEVVTSFLKLNIDCVEIQRDLYEPEYTSKEMQSKIKSYLIKNPDKLVEVIRSDERLFLKRTG